MILNKKYRSFILMLIFSSLIFGQENVIIKGSIKTSKGKPVNKANVVVIDTKIGTTSNKKGEFQFKIENNGYFNLEVSHVKYQKISKKLNPETDTVIFINSDNDKEGIKVEEGTYNSLDIEEVEGGEMPLKSYTFTHGDAKLSAKEKATLVAFFDRLRKE